MQHSVVLAGPAGTGKSTIAKLLGQQTQWPVIDKDVLTLPMVEELCLRLTGDKDDRHSQSYLDFVRPLEYQTMDSVMRDFAAQGRSAIFVAPYGAELATPVWRTARSEEMSRFKTRLSIFWVECAPEVMKHRITNRNASRDAWKLANWETFSSSVKYPTTHSHADEIIDNSSQGDESVVQVVRRIRDFLI